MDTKEAVLEKYRELYIDEAKKLLEEFKQSVKRVEKSSDDLSALNVMFRASHSLKSMSGAIGYSRMESLTEVMEAVIGSWRQNKKKIAPEMSRRLVKCRDTLELLLDGIIKGKEKELDLADLVRELKGAKLKEKEIPRVIKNYLEEEVAHLLDGLLEKRDDICKCSRCRADMMALALNRLPAKYTSTDLGRAYVKMESAERQFRTDVIRELAKAMKQVAEKPRHE